jgi:hypothetical protein
MRSGLSFGITGVCEWNFSSRQRDAGEKTIWAMPCRRKDTLQRLL